MLATNKLKLVIKKDLYPDLLYSRDFKNTLDANTWLLTIMKIFNLFCKIFLLSLD